MAAPVAGPVVYVVRIAAVRLGGQTKAVSLDTGTFPSPRTQSIAFQGTGPKEALVHSMSTNRLTFSHHAENIGDQSQDPPLSAGCRVPLDKSEGVVKGHFSWAVRVAPLFCQRG